MINDFLQSLPNPDTSAMLRAWGDDLMARFNCHMVGQIVAFDASDGTATVQPQIMRVVTNQIPATTGGLNTTLQTVTPPLLVKCPVFFATGGTAVLTLPVAPGDPCLVLFNDRDLDAWFDTGALAPPTTRRMHSISDGLVLVGFRPKTGAIPSFSTTAAELRNGTARVSIAPAEAVLTSGTATIDLDSKVGVSNASTSLKTALGQLFTALRAWTDTRGDTPNPATVTALNNAESTLNSLLK